MHILRVNVTFYDAVNVIHDVITIRNPFPYTAKFMFVSVINNETQQIRRWKINRIRTGWSKITDTISVACVLHISYVIWNVNLQSKTRDFKVLWYIKFNLIDKEIGAQPIKQDLQQMFNMTSILWFNNVHSSWSWSTTILLTAKFNRSSLLKSDYKLMHLKLYECSIIRVLFLHCKDRSYWRFSFKIQFYYFCSRLFWCRHLEKKALLVEVINGIITSTPSPTFHALETYVISLSNDKLHLIIA